MFCLGGGESGGCAIHRLFPGRGAQNTVFPDQRSGDPGQRRRLAASGPVLVGLHVGYHHSDFTLIG